MTKGLPKEFKKRYFVSRANSNRVYINLEAKGEKSGVYRSDDVKKLKQVTNRTL